MTPEELFENNKELVFYVTNKLKNSYFGKRAPLEPEDMEQVGFIGLWKACNKFDPSLGFKFSTYAVPKILGEITLEIRDKGIIKIPRQCKLISKKLFKRVDSGEKIPTVKQVIEEFGCNEEDARISIDLITLNIISIDAPVYHSDGSQTSIGDFLVDDFDFESHLIKRDGFNERMELLDDRQRKILSLALKGVTQTVIAKKLNTSQKTVCKWQKKALEKIKEYNEAVV